MALAITLLAGLFFLLGAAVAWKARGTRVVGTYSIAVAFGSLACVAALDLIPEAQEAAEELGALVAVGLVVFGAAALVALDRMMPDHHANGESHGHPHNHVHGEEEAAHLGTMAVLAVSVHNLAEGAAIYTIASLDLTAGLMLALGVGLHNAPMGMLLYSPAEANRSRGIAVLAAATLSTFVGGLIMFLLGGLIDEGMMLGVVCVALGMIAYILLAELLPAMIRTNDPKRSIAGALIGAAFVLVGLSLGGE